MKSYRVVLERDEAGAWVARIPSVPGCHTYGRSLVEARRRIREALGLWVDDANGAELVDDVRLPREALQAVRRSRAAREHVKLGQRRANELTADAARALVEDLELGVRDAGDLLGLSHQRVQQLVRR